MVVKICTENLPTSGEGESRMDTPNPENIACEHEKEKPCRSCATTHTAEQYRPFSLLLRRARVSVRVKEVAVGVLVPLVRTLPKSVAVFASNRNVPLKRLF